jgi:hypothetical protein
MGLFLLLLLHPMRPHLISWAGGRVGGCVSFVAEVGDGAFRLAQGGADVGGRDDLELRN